MHDGIELERRGIPTAVIVTAPFVATGRAMADLDGRPDYRFSVIRHPSAELRGDDLHQQLPLLHVIADVDVALVDIAAGASEYVGDRKRGGRGRQRDRHIIPARPHRLNPQGRDGIETLLGGRHSPYTLGI